MSMSTGGRPEGRLHSGAAMFTFDARKQIRSWNKGAEETTGIAADQVVGRYCWEVLCGRDEVGGTVCHAGCSFHRLLRARWPVAPPTLTIRTATGSRRVRVPMITLDDGTLFAALLVDPGEAPVPAQPGGPAAVTPVADPASAHGARDARRRQAGAEDRRRAPSLRDDRAQPHPRDPARVRLQLATQRRGRSPPARPRLTSSLGLPRHRERLDLDPAGEVRLESDVGVLDLHDGDR